MSDRPFVHSRMRSLRRATTPWIRFGKRKPDRRDEDDPLRKVRLHAKGRRFLRDAATSESTSTIMVALMAIMAMCLGYRMAHIWRFGPGGTLLAPFALVGVSFAIWGRLPLGGRVIMLVACGAILVWPIFWGGV